jgi:trimeric autotransporter adhesin
VGGGALIFNLNGSSNIAMGAAALLFNRTGSNNTAVGTDALVNNTVDGNTAIGFSALYANTTGGNLETSVLGFPLGPNTAICNNALEHNVDSSANTAVGYNALASQVTGFVLSLDPHFAANTAVGFEALVNVTGSASGMNAINTALGYAALFDLTDGQANVAVGANAGGALTSGIDNIFIGTFQGPETSDESFHTYIGNINITSLPTADTVDFVTIDLNTGLLGRNSSSRRYKEDIKPMNKTSEALYRLKPVSYRLKKEVDRHQGRAFGLVAEEVAQVNPDLIVRNAQGRVEGVHYEMVNTMLLNEFLKEHKIVQEQGATITHLQNQIEALTVGLHKASAELELSKAAPQTVMKDH